VKIKDKNSGKLINGKTLSGTISDIPAAFNFTLVLPSRIQFTSGSNSGIVTVKDAQFIAYTSATYISYTDVQVSTPISQFYALPTFSSSDTSVATIDESGLITPIAVGKTDITVIICGLGVQRTTVIVTQFGGQTTQTFQNYASGSLGLHMRTSILSLINGLTSPDFTGNYQLIGNPPYPWSSLINLYTEDFSSRNMGGWWGDVDVTCITNRTSDYPWGTNFNGTLITPRDMIFAKHFGPQATGQQIIFVDNDNNRIIRTVVAFSALFSPSGDGSDILVATLDSDVPDSITPSKIMPANFRNYLPYCRGGYPVVFTNQDRTLLIGLIEEYGYQFDSSGSTLPILIRVSARLAGGILGTTEWFYGVRNFDSGSPCFMLINGELVLITDWHYALAGPVISDNISQINSAIAVNAANLSIDPYTVITADLSGFISY